MGIVTPEDKAKAIKSIMDSFVVGGVIVPEKLAEYLFYLIKEYVGESHVHPADAMKIVKLREQHNERVAKNNLGDVPF